MKANKKEGWVPMWFKRMPPRWKRPEPKYPPSMSNHERSKALALQSRAKQQVKTKGQS